MKLSTSCVSSFLQLRASGKFFSAISVPEGLLDAFVFGGSSRRFVSESSSWRLEGPSRCSRLRRVFPTLRFRKFFLAARRSFFFVPEDFLLFLLFCCRDAPVSFSVWSVNWPDLVFSIKIFRCRTLLLASLARWGPYEASLGFSEASSNS